MSKYSTRIKDWPADQRPRERLRSNGAEALTDAEVLAIILRTGGREDSALELARYMITRFGGFRGLDQRPFDDLCSIQGIGPAKAAQIKAAVELGKRLFRESSPRIDRIMSSDHLFSLVGPRLRNLDHEVFKIVLLTSRNTVISEHTLFKGTLDESVASPREVVREALNASAAGVVLVHNHPSGSPEPSDQDRLITKNMQRACKATQIDLLDHIIVGGDSYFSFADSGLL